MATKTKSGGGTLALFLAVVLGAGFFYGLAKRDQSDERSGVVFSVVFEPKERITFVDIVIFVDDIPGKPTQVRKSPWEQLVTLRRGQTARLTATQSVSAKLSCAANGQIQETRTFPGTVTCTHKRAK